MCCTSVPPAPDAAPAVSEAFLSLLFSSLVPDPFARTADSTLLRQFYDSLPLMMGVMEMREQDLCYLSCNAATRHFIGADETAEAAIQGRSVREFGLSEEQFAHFYAHYEQSQQENAPVRFDYSGVYRDVPCWLSATVCYLGQTAAQTSAFSFVVEDVTERREVERALRRANKRVVNILDSITDAFFALDRDWRFTYVNPVAERIFRRTRAEMLGHVFWELFPCARNTRFPEELPRAVARQEAITFETTVHRVWFQVAAFPSQDGLSVYARDISERKLAEQQVQYNVEKMQRSLDGIVQAMSFSVEIRDPYTAGHQRRVSTLAAAIARQMGLSDRDVKAIHTAGLLHDVGKIAVPAEILSRPGALSKAERSIIEIHCQQGHDILQGIEFDAPVALVALQHHERLDGSGYPAGLKGAETIFEARLMAVADVVEAMASHRPYRPALGIERALEEILQKRGILYEAAVVDACFDLLRDHGFDLEALVKSDLESL